MKHFRFCLLLFLPLALACSRKAYDISEGFNPELTLFEDQISVPVGSIGPLTLNLVFNKLGQTPGIGTLLADYIKIGDDGYLNMEDSGTILSANVYELERMMPDPGVASSCNAGSRSGFIGGLVGLLDFINLKASRQKFTITATNPLYQNVAATSTSTYNGSGLSEPIEGLASFTLPRSSTVELVSQSLPDSFSSPLTSLRMSDVTLSLPANPTSVLDDKNKNVFFSFNYKYTGTLAVGEAFSLDLGAISVGDVKLEIGQYKLKKCQLTMELENTLPMQVTIGDIVVYKPRASKEEEEVADENIVITSGITVAGGSPEHPATTPVTIGIEALEGTIPDLREIEINLKIAAQPDLGIVPLSATQGLFVKNAKATLSGGITLPIAL